MPELAWAAGLFDGEGSIFRKTNPQYKTSYWGMSLAMKDRDVVEQFAKIVGVGNFRFDGKLWLWRTDKRADVLTVCMALFPFMGERRRAKMREAMEELSCQSTSTAA